MLVKGFAKWYFGWNIVVMSAIITLLTVGLRMGIGPFFKTILEDLNMSRTILSVIVSVGMLVYGVGMPVAGYLVEKYSTKFVLLLGVGIIIFSIIWTVLAKNTISFFLAFGVLLSLGLSFTSPVAVTPIISRWFTRRRGRALFYLSTGSMVGLAIMTPLLTFTIELVGWRNTLLLFAAIFALILIPSAFFVMRDQAPLHTDQFIEDTKQVPNKKPEIIDIDWKDAIKNFTFWQVVAGLFVCGFSMNLLGVHGIPMLTDHGFDNMTASGGIGLIGLTAIFGSIYLGSLSDRYPRKNLLSSIYFFRGIGFFSLVLLVTKWQLYSISIIAGIVWAGSIALSSAILVDIYGIKSIGVLYGLTYLGHQIGAAISTLLGGWGYEAFGTHLISFGSAAALLFLASWISFKLPSKLPLKSFERQ